MARYCAHVDILHTVHDIYIHRKQTAITLLLKIQPIAFEIFPSGPKWLTARHRHSQSRTALAENPHFQPRLCVCFVRAQC